MSTRFQKGDAALDGIIMLVVISIIIFLFVLPAGKTGPAKTMSGFGSAPPPSNPSTPLEPTITTSYKGALSISPGSAQYAYQPYQEYITLSNHGSQSIDISGWKLEDGRGQRTYNVGGAVEHFPSISATIPSANGQDIVLNSGDYADIVTGSVDNTNPYTVTSMRENECLGYIANTPGYNFSPPVNTQCVQPYLEPGAQTLDTQCQNFLKKLSPCQTPKFDTINSYDNYTADSQGNTCAGCVNGVAGLSNQCIAFIKEHFSYQGCLAYHSGDANFESKVWRIYLDQPWEMWAADHDTISLFDLQGRLAAYEAY
jgi:Lamin Tail Domain